MSVDLAKVRAVMANNNGSLGVRWTMDALDEMANEIDTLRAEVARLKPVVQAVEEDDSTGLSLPYGTHLALERYQRAK